MLNLTTAVNFTRFLLKRAVKVTTTVSFAHSVGPDTIHYGHALDLINIISLLIADRSIGSMCLVLAEPNSRSS